MRGHHKPIYLLRSSPVLLGILFMSLFPKSINQIRDFAQVGCHRALASPQSLNPI